MTTVGGRSCDCLGRVSRVMWSLEGVGSKFGRKYVYNNAVLEV